MSCFSCKYLNNNGPIHAPYWCEVNDELRGAVLTKEMIRKLSFCKLYESKNNATDWMQETI